MCLNCKNTIEESGVNGARSKVSREIHQNVPGSLEKLTIMFELPVLCRRFSQFLRGILGPSRMQEAPMHRTRFPRGSRLAIASDLVA
jgi:hypothetical protein